MRGGDGGGRCLLQLAQAGAQPSSSAFSSASPLASASACAACGITCSSAARALSDAWCAVSRTRSSASTSRGAALSAKLWVCCETSATSAESCSAWPWLSARRVDDALFDPGQFGALFGDDRGERGRRRRGCARSGRPAHPLRRPAATARRGYRRCAHPAGGSIRASSRRSRARSIRARRAGLRP